MNEQPIKQPDQLTIKALILKTGALSRYLAGRWVTILLIAFVFAVAGILYAALKTNYYTAEYTFVLEDGTSSSSGGGLGQYSALASLAGIDIGNNSGIFQGDNISQLYQSRLMIARTLLTKVNFTGRNQLLIDRFIDIKKMRKAWSGNDQLKNISFDTLKGKFNMLQDSLLILFVNDINKNYLSVDRPDKKLSVISVKLKSQDALFAKAFVETIVENVNKFYVQTKTKSSLGNLQLLQRQADSLRTVLNMAIRGSAAAQDANADPNPIFQGLKVPSQRRQIDVQANTAMYTEAVKNLALARSVLQRETPLIQIIDQPMLPLPNDKVSKFKSFTVGGIIGVLIALFFLTTQRVYRKILD